MTQPSLPPPQGEEVVESISVAQTLMALASTSPALIPQQPPSLAKIQDLKSEYLGQNCSPCGPDEALWTSMISQFHSQHQQQQRERFASVSSSCTSESDLDQRHFNGNFHAIQISNTMNPGRHAEEEEDDDEEEDDEEEYDDEEEETKNQHAPDHPIGCGTGTGANKYIGCYSPAARRRRIHRFLEKRKRRIWSKKVDYGVRKNFADSRLRVKGRFVKKEDEALLCKMLSLT